MYPELALAVLVGICCGIVTGLTPGVHINLVAAILLGLAPLLVAPPLVIGAIIVAMGVTHNFLDVIPGIFLGAPDDAMAMGVLPGHRYLLHGQGLMAVKLTIIGGILGTLLVALLFLPLITMIALVAAWTRAWLFWLLAAFTIYTILKDARRLWALVVFALSGLLGIVVLRLPLDEPLLPLLSGIFGTATLLYSIKEENHLPEQQDLDRTDFDKRKTLLGSSLGTLGACITAIFPGISSAMAAALVSRGGRLGDHGFMVLIGALGSASFLLSLAAWLAIGKARNGAMAVVVSLVDVTPAIAAALVGVALLATGVAAVLTLWMGRRAARWLPRMPYETTCWLVIAFVTLIVLLRAGWLGLLVLATSTAVGMIPAVQKTARAQGMGCLMLPLLVVLW